MVMLICLLAFAAISCATGAKIPPPPGGSTPVFQNECKDTSLNDCPPEALCIDHFYGYTCQCKSGFVDKSPDADRPGRTCVAGAEGAAAEAATPQSGGQGEEATAPVTKRPHRAKVTTSQPVPVEGELTKSPAQISEVPADLTATEKPKTHRKSKGSGAKNSTKPKEDGPKEERPGDGATLEQPKEIKQTNETSKAALRDTFNFFDTSQDGQINLAELKAATRSLNQRLSNDDLKRMLETADKNGDGVVSFSEFKALMRARQLPSS